MLKIKKLLPALFFLSIALSINSQNTNTPYSRYGYGVLRDDGIGVSRAMGGIGYGLRRNANVNPANPASYSKIDSLTFLFEMGINYSRARLSDPSGSKTRDNGGLDYITMMMPFSKNIGFSVGLIPYSSVGYNFGDVQTIDGNSFVRQFIGEGGFNKAYAGLAYQIKNVSVGANVNFLWGTLTHTRTIPQISSSSAYLQTSQRQFRLSTFTFDIGAQYSIDLSKNGNLTLGAVFSPALNPKGTYSGIDYSSSSVSDTLPERKIVSGFPNSFGAGFTYSHGDKWMAGADVSYQQWSKVESDDVFKVEGHDFSDRIRVAAGFEYTINPLDRSFLKRIKFRGGANYANSYLNAVNNAGEVGGYKEIGGTVGVGLPFKDRNFTGRTSYINVNLEYKHISPDIANAVKEQYFGISVSVNINDLWFVKSKFR